MYTNQDCDVQWDGAHSFNGVKQGSVISQLHSHYILIVCFYY